MPQILSDSAICFRRFILSNSAPIFSISARYICNASNLSALKFGKTRSGFSFAASRIAFSCCAIFSSISWYLNRAFILSAPSPAFNSASSRRIEPRYSLRLPKASNAFSAPLSKSATPANSAYMFAKDRSTFPNTGRASVNATSADVPSLVALCISVMPSTTPSIVRPMIPKDITRLMDSIDWLVVF